MLRNLKDPEVISIVQKDWDENFASLSNDPSDQLTRHFLDNGYVKLETVFIIEPRSRHRFYGPLEHWDIDLPEILMTVILSLQTNVEDLHVDTHGEDCQRYLRDITVDLEGIARDIRALNEGFGDDGTVSARTKSRVPDSTLSSVKSVRVESCTGNMEPDAVPFWRYGNVSKVELYRDNGSWGTLLDLFQRVHPEETEGTNRPVMTPDGENIKQDLDNGLPRITELHLLESKTDDTTLASVLQLMPNSKVLHYTPLEQFTLGFVGFEDNSHSDWESVGEWGEGGWDEDVLRTRMLLRTRMPTATRMTFGGPIPRTRCRTQRRPGGADH